MKLWKSTSRLDRDSCISETRRHVRGRGQCLRNFQQ